MKGIQMDGDIRIEPRLLPDGGITGLVVADVTYQHQKFILYAHPGEYKESPLTGVGIEDYIEDDSPEVLLREIRTQLSADGMSVKTVGFNQKGNLEIEASYV